MSMDVSISIYLSTSISSREGEWLVGPPPTEGCLYQLCAVVCHLGSTSRSGHYTTEALVDGTWFSFDDPRVTPLATFKPKADAYLLFYQRQHVTT